MIAARRIVVAAISMGLLLCARAEAKPRFGLEAWGGWNQLRMNAINDTLDSFNREYATALAPIRDCTSWGLGLRLSPREDVLVRLGVEHLPARSEDSGVEFDLGAYAVTLGATGYLPSSGRSHFGLGLGLGPIFEQGGLTAPGATLSVSGTGFVAHLAGEAAVELGGGCSLQGQFGYRWASVQGLKFGEYTTNIDADYSGPFVRVGLAFDGRRAE